MRIAHISDLHVLALQGAVPFRLFNKRATGYANLRLYRKHVHRSEIVRTIAAHLAETGVDHVVVTGDVSNLALEAEFEAVRAVLDDVLRLPPSSVTIVPGNHDVYTRGAQKQKRFARYFEPYLASDLPHLCTHHPGGLFPIVKVRGPVAIIGLSSAMARPPFVAAGRLGRDQLDALEQILATPLVKDKCPIVVVHHPLENPPTWTWMKSRLEGLEDARHLKNILRTLPRGLLLHGHLHRRMHRKLATQGGHIDMLGAASASLVHTSPARMAGYNLYEFADDGGIVALSSYRYDDAKGTFDATPF
ncbi:MAG TPA: metallophosphoesterase [Polyangiaceae bacterium]